EESWLDMRAGELLGVAEEWVNAGTYRVLYGLVRHMAGGMDQQHRPPLACETETYATTDATLRPLHFLPLSTNKASRYRKDYGLPRVLTAPDDDDHPGSGHGIDWDWLVDEWRREIVHWSGELAVSLETAAERILAEGVGLPNTMKRVPDRELMRAALKAA